MSWNYRICKQTYSSDGWEEVSFEIKEVYYNASGNIWAVTERGATIHGDNVEEIKEVMDKMSMALAKEVVDLDTLVFDSRDN